jgi:hypothetical protein
MIRDHLLAWRRKLESVNKQEYYNEVQKLPVDDQPVAYALWGVVGTDAMIVLVAFHFLDQATEEGLLGITLKQVDLKHHLKKLRSESFGVTTDYDRALLDLYCDALLLSGPERRDAAIELDIPTDSDALTPARRRRK